MFNIATVDESGNKQYLVGLDGKKMEWFTKAEADNQVACFNRSVSILGNAGEPRNFRWIVEAA